MPNDIKKILILGDRGQLGSEVIKQLASQEIPFLRGSDYSLDITDKNSLESHLDQLVPDTIVNAAAYTAVDAAEKNQQKAFSVNGEAPKNIAAWCKKHASYLVHISTDYVFSGEKSLYDAYSEQDSVNPASVYGLSKLKGETNIMSAMPNNYAILRTAWLYGFYGNNFLKTMLKLTLSNPTRQFKVVNDQFGSPTSTIALSLQIISLIHQAQQPHAPSGIFHATSSGHCSWYDFACEFFKLMNIEHKLVPCTTLEYPTDACRPKNSILENKHLDYLEINSFVDWRKDLADFVDRHGDELIKEIQ